MAWIYIERLRRGVSAIALIACTVFAGWPCWAAEPAPVEGIYRSAQGETVSIDLIPMPDRYHDDIWQILDLFAASPDSSFWCGPNKPNPHSWLGPSVICREDVDFQIDVLLGAEEKIETLEFNGVRSGFYRLSSGCSGAKKLCTLRFRQSGAVVNEFKIGLPVRR